VVQDEPPGKLQRALDGEVVLFAMVGTVKLLSGLEEFVTAVAGNGGGLLKEFLFLGIGQRLEVAGDGDLGFEFLHGEDAGDQR
jgi:hypothetical protein